MDELLQLIESCGGVRSLSLYQQDGLCWQKRGELRLTPAIIEAIRDAYIETTYDCPIHGRLDGPDCPRC